MMKELESHEPFEVSVGCPTVTFELADQSLMLPWSSFTCGHFMGGGIKLIFQDWSIGIEGFELMEVWKLLQLQDVRELRRSGESEGCSQCPQIRSIKADAKPTM